MPNQRIKHTLWKCENGWILIPEEDQSLVDAKDAGRIVVFKTLKEFSDWKPTVKRNRKPKPTPATPTKE